MRLSRPAGLALAALTTTLTLVTPAQAAAPTVELQPHELARGADIAVPHIDDGDFVHGDLRVELPGTVAHVIGRSMGAWLVGTYDVGARRDQGVVRVQADGTVTEVLRRVDPATVLLSETGSTLYAVGRARKDGAAPVRVWSPVDGALVATRTFRGFPELVTADSVKVLIRAKGRTFWWKSAKDHVRRVTTRLTGPASARHDLLVTYTKDPYLGGCTRLVQLRHPKRTRWTSCRDRVAAISPDGTRMLTFDILTDGLGPGQVHLRTVDGTRLATYTTNWFSGWEWETPDSLLLDVNGRRRSATVRCTLGDCENATDPVPVQAP